MEGAGGMKSSISVFCILKLKKKEEKVKNEKLFSERKTNKNREDPILTHHSFLFSAYIVYYFSVLPVPTAAEQVVRSPRRWHRLRRSFSSSQQIHDKV